ncbi:hypothetical protein COCOBI_04-7260 [Coccomyxa sp. Obi]|nr:hypothetical protein COCOBI_04-7260 [Coccomyxa sp. Obi]
MGLPNAFAVLKTSAKRRATDPSPDGQASASNKRKSTGESTRTESSFESCPVCNNKFHRIVLPFHINSCLNGGVGKSTGSPAPPKPSAQSLPEPSRAASESTSLPSQPGNSALDTAAGTAANAFAHMIQSQREQSQTWSFFLGRKPDGAYFWHMWRDSVTSKGGSPTDQGVDEQTQKHLTASAKWSASVQVPLAALECRSENTAASAAATKVTLKLLTDIEPGAANTLSTLEDAAVTRSSAPGWEYTGNNGLLKSALQKNIRLGRADAAVRVALRLLQQDASELLRRACIISLEDTLLHPSLPLMVWLMAALPKGYTMGRMLALACLNIIHGMACVPVRDHCKGGAAAPGSSSASGVQLEPAACNLVRCMLLRAAYGGMGGDVSMLRKFAAIWHSRFTSNERPPQLKTSDPAQQQGAQPDTWTAYLHQQFSTTAGSGMKPLGSLRPEDIPLSAVDFHISDIVYHLLDKPEITTAALDVARDPTELMRQAIWQHSSSINRRSWLLEPEPEQETRSDRARWQEQRASALENVWKIAAPAAKAYARSYRKARFREVSK